MNKFKAWGPSTPTETKLELENRSLARSIAGDSIVLLKNEQNILPLKGNEIALYGAGARMTTRGGVGSGDTRERYSVNIEKGLQNAGYTITSQKWLDRFDKEYQEYTEHRRNLIEEKVKDYTMDTVLEMFETIAAIPLQYPTGTIIREEEFPEKIETAMYVISRQAGEGRDRLVEPGDFLLNDIEKTNIKALAERSKEVVVIINCGSMIDISPLMEIPKVKAILYMGQGGMEGGNALADILSGRKCPSGKLVDTWGKKYEDFPSADTFSHMNGDLDNEDYNEGIFVGYRYFESFDIEPLYEFGFGLSYTQFSHEVIKQEIQKDMFNMKVKVKNIGNQYAGKEVIQLYLSKPGKRFETEKIALCGFSKTSELSPNEEEVLSISFSLNDLGVYDEERACWLIEEGEYTILVGNSSKNIKTTCALVSEKEIIIEQVENICPLLRKIEELSLNGKNTHIDAGNVERFTLDPAQFKKITHVYEPYKAVPSEKTKNVMSQLTVEDMVTLCVGENQFAQLYNLTPGAAGSTTVALLDKGIPNITMSDGPAGLNVLPETVIQPDGVQLYLNGIPESNNYGFIKETAPYSVGSPESGRPIYQYMTAWPVTINQAQTWDTDLLRRMGEAIGKEMITIGASLWLAPAINIHRNPLCGRNFEYFSEDPYLSAVLASSLISGVESQDGVGVTLKHFCCNNQEDNRDHVSSNLTERTLREIYVRAFKYVIEQCQPKTIMSSYNLVNGVYVANSYDLLTKLLRNEFGFQGLVMTDWNAAATGKADCNKCQEAGNDLIMPGFQYIIDSIVEAVHSGQISQEVIERSAIKVLNLIFSSATSDDFSI